MPKLNPTRAAQVAQVETTSYEPLPDGVYPAKLRDVTTHEGRTAPYWRWEYEITDPQYAGRRMWYNTSLSDRALWRLRNVFDAFCVPADTNTDDLIGLSVQLAVGSEIQEQGAGAGQTRNVVRDVLPSQLSNSEQGLAPSTPASDPEPF